MEKVYYKKLIRDKIPDKILKRGSFLETRTMKPEEFGKRLSRKMVEEAKELMVAENRSEIIAELADILDIIDAFKELKEIKAEEIKKQRVLNQKIKGGFKKRLFLVWSSRDGYQDKESKCKI